MSRKKKKVKSNALSEAIKQQVYDMEHGDKIMHHRDNETNRKRNGKPSRR
jgi:hypothetical protein